MSPNVTYILDFGGDPRKTLRRQFEEFAKQSRERDLVHEYAARRTGAEARTLSGESSALSQRNDAPAGPMRA